MKHVYLGLDAGSSVTKAALFDASGRQLGEALCRLDLKGGLRHTETRVRKNPLDATICEW